MNHETITAILDRTDFRHAERIALVKLLQMGLLTETSALPIDMSKASRGMPGIGRLAICAALAKARCIGLVAQAHPASSGRGNQRGGGYAWWRAAPLDEWPRLLAERPRLPADFAPRSVNLLPDNWKVPSLPSTIEVKSDLPHCEGVRWVDRHAIVPWTDATRHLHVGDEQYLKKQFGARFVKMKLQNFWEFPPESAAAAVAEIASAERRLAAARAMSDAAPQEPVPAPQPAKAEPRAVPPRDRRPVVDAVSPGQQPIVIDREQGAQIAIAEVHGGILPHQEGPVLAVLEGLSAEETDEVVRYAGVGAESWDLLIAREARGKPRPTIPSDPAVFEIISRYSSLGMRRRKDFLDDWIGYAIGHLLRLREIEPVLAAIARAADGTLPYKSELKRDKRIAEAGFSAIKRLRAMQREPRTSEKTDKTLIPPVSKPFNMRLRARELGDPLPSELLKVWHGATREIPRMRESVAYRDGTLMIDMRSPWQRAQIQPILGNMLAYIEEHGIRAEVVEAESPALA